MAQVTIGSLIKQAQLRGAELQAFKDLAEANQREASFLTPANDTVPTPAPVPLGLDLSRFDARNRWTDIPVRKWLVGTVALRGFYSLIVSPGGRGKTALAVMMAVSAALGRSDIGGFIIRGKLRVAFISGEDSGQEMMRRMRAICQEYGIAPADLGDRLLIIGAREVAGLVFNRGDPSKQCVADEKGLGLLEQIGREHRADLIICDPLVSFCPGGLNDNSSMSSVMSRIAQITERLSCGIILLHHVGKAAVRGGDEASAMSGLGAVSISSHARVALSLMPIDKAAAPTLGILPSEAWRHFRLVNTKANLAPVGDDELFELKSVTLPNAEPQQGYPHGDNVQVAKPFKAGTIGSVYPPPVFEAVLRMLARGVTTGDYAGMPFSPAKRSDRDYRLQAAAELENLLPDQTDPQREVTGGAIVAELVQRGWVEVSTVKRPRKPGAGKGGPTSARGLHVRWDRTTLRGQPPSGPHTALSPACNGATVGNGPIDE